MTTIKLSGGDLCNETMLVRCNLAQASAPVQADYMTGDGDGWCATQYQCADCRHTVSGLAEIGRLLAASACEMPADVFACDWEEVATA